MSQPFILEKWFTGGKKSQNWKGKTITITLTLTKYRKSKQNQYQSINQENKYTKREGE